MYFTSIRNVKKNNRANLKEKIKIEVKFNSNLQT